MQVPHPPPRMFPSSWFFLRWDCVEEPSVVQLSSQPLRSGAEKMDVKAALSYAVGSKPTWASKGPASTKQKLWLAM